MTAEEIIQVAEVAAFQACDVALQAVKDACQAVRDATTERTASFQAWESLPGTSAAKSAAWKRFVIANESFDKVFSELPVKP